MIRFETKTLNQGFINGVYFYDFIDIFGKPWRITTKHTPEVTKKFRILSGNLKEFPETVERDSIYKPKLSIFLGALSPGKIEFGDIKIKED